MLKLRLGIIIILLLRFSMEDSVLLEKLMWLASRQQWVVHRNKVPFSPRVPYWIAKSNAPETWGTFQEVQEALSSGSFDGLGFEFGVLGSEELRVSGIDLDHVVREDGTVEPFASEIVSLMKSYTEYSPSGKGLHILCETVLEDIGRRRGLKGSESDLVFEEDANDGCVIEMYNNRRYFTVMGNIYGEALPVAERTVEFREVYEKYFGSVGSDRSEFLQLKEDVEEGRRGGERSKRVNVLDMSDQELLRRMFNSRRGYEIQKLFSGDWSSYWSQSEADLALVSHLLCSGRSRTKIG